MPLATYCLLRNQCIMCMGGTDIPVCANRGTDRNVCATDALVAQLSIDSVANTRSTRFLSWKPGFFGLRNPVSKAETGFVKNHE